MSDFDTLSYEASGVLQPLSPLTGILHLDFDNFDQAMLAAGIEVASQLRGQVIQLIQDCFGAEWVSFCEGSLGVIVELRGTERGKALVMIDRLLREITLQRVEMTYGACSMSARAGIAWAELDFDAPALLYSRAHSASVTAKARRLSMMIYGEEAAAAETSARLICDLTAAMEEDRLLLVAQEIRNLHPDAARQFEVLLQMRDRNGVNHSPAKFVPLAERSWLIEALDHWVIQRALLGYAEELQIHDDICLSLNVSGRSLSSAALWPMVRDTLEAAQIDPARIQLEITETSAIHDMEQARLNVNAARSAGVKVALDDFGAGLSGYMYLKQLDVTCIKIDGALIPNVVQESSLERKIVGSVVALAHHLGLEVVAEHVSSAEILAALIPLGVDKVQGYEVGVPFPYGALFESS